jgi:hypothetical protein
MKSILIILLAVVALEACTGKAETATILCAPETRECLIDSLPGQAPYLTKDNKGNTVLSWVRMINDSTAAFCYAVSTDGKKFGNPVVIPNSHNIKPHGENAPKIIFKQSGEIIALWGTGSHNSSNKYAGLVLYTQSFDEGKTWTGPKPLTSDTASYDQRYYDVALLKNGEAAIIWLDNRTTTPGEGSALYYASTSGRNGFTNEKRISEHTCQCCRTDLFVDTKGNIHALFRGIIQDSMRDMVHMVSEDGAKTFSAPTRISKDNWVINGCPHTGPAMTENSDGLHFAWFTGGGKKGCYYTQSSDNGRRFAARDSVSSKGSHPQMTTLVNNDLVIVWDELIDSGDEPAKRIGVQRRDAKGVSLGKKFITSPTAIATYPVVSGIDATNSMIAYSLKKGDRNYVAYQVVSL